VTAARVGILAEILKERDRQDLLKMQGKFATTCADDIPNELRLVVLAEEFGEVAREVCDLPRDPSAQGRLREELVQTAAVCLAWLEGLA
jgi:hypothetical protein